MMSDNTLSKVLHLVVFCQWVILLIDKYENIFNASCYEVISYDDDVFRRYEWKRLHMDKKS